MANPFKEGLSDHHFICGKRGELVGKRPQDAGVVIGGAADYVRVKLQQA